MLFSKLSKRAKSTRKQYAVAYLEAIISVPVVIFVIFIIIEMSRLTWIKTSIRTALSYAVKKAESEKAILTDLHDINGNDPHYNAFLQAREAVIQEALNYKLGFLFKKDAVQFMNFAHIDQLADRDEFVSSKIAVLLPAMAGKVTDSVTNATRYVTNSHICPRPSQHAATITYLNTSTNFGACSGREREPDEKISDLVLAYPFEVKAFVKVDTFLLGKVNLEVTSAGYIMPMAAVAPTVTPTPTPTPTIQVPTIDPPKYNPPVETPQVPIIIPTPQVPSQPTVNICAVYYVEVRNKAGGAQLGEQILTGDMPSCLNQIVSSCGAQNNTTNMNIAAQDADRDDCVAKAILGSLYGPSNNVTLVNNPGSPYKYTYLNSSCQRIPNPGYNCGQLNVRVYDSPISLFWEEGVDLSSIVSLVQFPLNPSEHGKWYDWRASAKTPLLVHDPERSGKITTAAQLFGSYTFGKQWKNGYEALATLDQNSDGKVSGDELRDISLWFDNNQDGISQKGEVIPSENLHISAIYTAHDGAKEGSKDIFAKLGYERTINGKAKTLPSVDWFSMNYNSKMEALIEKSARPHTADKKNEHANKEVSTTEPIALQKGRPISGAWQWKMTEDASFPGANIPTGLLTLVEKDGIITGHSYVEAPLGMMKGQTGNKLVMMYTVNGEKKVSGNGITSISFKVKDAQGIETVSEAKLSDDGQELTGLSNLMLNQEGSGSIEYTWTAKKQ